MTFPNPAPGLADSRISVFRAAKPGWPYAGTSRGAAVARASPLPWLFSPLQSGLSHPVLAHRGLVGWKLALGVLS